MFTLYTYDNVPILLCTCLVFTLYTYDNVPILLCTCLPCIHMIMYLYSSDLLLKTCINQGYWRNHLAGRKYHISAIYVVDLVKFRQIAAGDRLRGRSICFSIKLNMSTVYLLASEFSAINESFNYSAVYDSQLYLNSSVYLSPVHKSAAFWSAVSFHFVTDYSDHFLFLEIYLFLMFLISN